MNHLTAKEIMSLMHPAGKTDNIREVLVAIIRDAKLRRNTMSVRKGFKPSYVIASHDKLIPTSARTVRSLLDRKMVEFTGDEGKLTDVGAQVAKHYEVRDFVARYGRKQL